MKLRRLTGINRTTNKCFTIRVTDPELLERTGGNVQGMSGSPILQDGRLMGAVTHVLVNDPAQGYGIFHRKYAGRRRDKFGRGRFAPVFFRKPMLY